MEYSRAAYVTLDTFVRVRCWLAPNAKQAGKSTPSAGDPLPSNMPFNQVVILRAILVVLPWMLKSRGFEGCWEEKARINTLFAPEAFDGPYAFCCVTRGGQPCCCCVCVVRRLTEEGTVRVAEVFARYEYGVVVVLMCGVCHVSGK